MDQETAGQSRPIPTLEMSETSAERSGYYQRKLESMFRAWGQGKDSRGARNDLSKQFLTHYIGSLGDASEHAAFVIAYTSVRITILGVTDISKRFTRSSEAEILLSALKDGFEPGGLTVDILITLCETAYVDLDYVLIDIARGTFEHLFYQATAEVGLARIAEICCTMTHRVLWEDREGAKRIYDALMYYYQEGHEVPLFVENFFKKVFQASLGYGEHFSEWDISDPDKFIDLAHWVDLALHNVATYVDGREVYQAAIKVPTEEAFDKFAFLDDYYLARMALILLSMRATEPYLGHPKLRPFKEYVENLQLDTKMKNIAFVLSLIFELEPTNVIAQKTADRIASLTGLQLESIGAAIRRGGSEIRELMEQLEPLLDSFMNRGSDLEILGKQLTVKYYNAEQPYSAVVLCLKGRYKVFSFQPERGEGPMTSEAYRALIIEIYRRANQEKRVIGLNELVWMCHAMILQFDVSEPELTLPFWRQEFYKAYARVFSEEGDGEGDIQSVFQEIREEARKILSRGFCTFAPGGGDIVLIDKGHDLYRILGIRSIHFTLEESNLMGIDIRFDNAVARFLADYEMNVYVRGDLSLSEVAKAEHRLEKELAPVDPSESPYVAFWYEMLILGTLVEFLRGSIIERAELVKGSNRVIRRGREPVEGRLAVLRRGHKRTLPTGQHYTAAQAKLVRDELGIDLRKLNEDLETVDDGGGYTTFHMPIRGEAGQRQRRKPNVWRVPMRTRESS